MSIDSLSVRQNAAQDWFRQLQHQIISGLEQLECDLPGPFPPETDAVGTTQWTRWQRKNQDGSEGGGGTAAILKGRLFEKAGVHFSAVHGRFLPEFATQIPGAAQNPQFWASGLSLIIHPWNPHVPTIHMNTRYVVTTKSWFGGGTDLTPMLDQRRTEHDKDAAFFHEQMHAICDRHPLVASHSRFKAWCDKYFYLAHRQEPRGIGGIFFDYLEENPTNSVDWQTNFAFVQDVGRSFIGIYDRIVRNNFTTPWNDQERREQLIRRGRYVEFNLLYDRGTLFGLKTGGNVETILSSMPPSVLFP